MNLREHIKPEEKYKNFDDLIFEPHATQMNGDELWCKYELGTYGVSVVFGSIFYSDGIETYEVAITKNNILNYETDITNDVIGYITEDKVSIVMKYVQLLDADGKLSEKDLKEYKELMEDVC